MYIHRVVPNLKVLKGAIFYDFPHSCVSLRVNHGQLIAMKPVVKPRSESQRPTIWECFYGELGMA